MEQIIRDNISAIFALAGAFIGAAWTFLGAWILQRQEAKTRLLEKVLDRRIEAHEKVIGLSKSLRQMVSLGYDEDGVELVRMPLVMASPKSFTSFFAEFNQTSSDCSTWLSTEVTRELNFAQDYFVNLYELLRQVGTDSRYPNIGCLIRQDFIDLSSNLERLAFAFFANDLTRMRLNDLAKWHKYPLDTTKRRLNETALGTKREEILEIINSGERRPSPPPPSSDTVT